ncbi:MULTISPECIES: hypothetical protein [unclassified Rhizobium]|uniref:hypothetical protein n=1 Tax=unclassified Rhizobium TaxID=2613769 RepID=UPI0011AB6AF7|nr:MULTISPECIES: hypothetical protein [unclassified Rhizobium]
MADQNGKKEKLDFIRHISWYPNDAGYRKDFLIAVEYAFDHLLNHGDCQFLTLIARKCADLRFKESFTLLIESNSCLKFDSRQDAFKKTSKSTNRPSPDQLRKLPWPREKVGTQREFKNNDNFQMDEFLDDVIDCLIVNRNRIGVDNLRPLAETVYRLAERAEKRTKE